MAAIISGIGAVIISGIHSINEAPPRTGAKTAFEIETQGDESGGYPLHKALIAHKLWKRITPMNRHMTKIEVFEVSIARLMKGNQERHDFTHA